MSEEEIKYGRYYLWGDFIDPSHSKKLDEAVE
jgi:hypothetical protein